MNVRRIISLIAWPSAVFAIVAVGAACGAAQEPTATTTRAPTVASPSPATTATPSVKAPKFGGVAVLPQRLDPPGWDTMTQSTLDLTLLAGPLYGDGGLTKPCREDVFQVCPLLAESWSANADFTVWTFKIRDNVVWHDGRRFTAEDARWWLNLAFNGAQGRRPANYKSRLGPIEKLEVVEGDKVRITLSRPIPKYLVLLSLAEDAHPPHLMQPEIDKGNGGVAPNDVGWVATGPFKMTKYDRGSVVQVRRFDKYWEKDQAGAQLPYLDGIDFPIIRDPAAAFSAFRTGRVDRTIIGRGFYLTPDQRKTLQREMGGKATVVTIPPFGKLVGINARRAPYSDVRVRQAISLWLDRQSAIQAITDGDGVIAAVWIPGTPYANPDVGEWPGWNPKTKDADRKRAKELLVQAGYPNGFNATVMCGQPWVIECEWLGGQLTPLLGEGKVRLDIIDTATYNGRLSRGEFEMIQPLSGGVQDRYSPELLASGYITTNPGSYVQHDDKKVDEYFERIAATADEAQRTKLARELERYVSIEQWLAINIYLEGQYAGLRDYVKGWFVPAWDPSYNADMVTTWLDK